MYYINILAFLINYNFVFDDLGWTGSWSNCNQIIWGNGKRESNELWDDGNTSDGDGWSSLCKVEINWEWSGGNSTSKDQWSEVVNQGIIYNLFNKYIAMSKTGQAAAAAAGGAAALFSFCNLSTPTGLWITMNQFQLILLLLLTKSSIPKSIVDYLSGLKATTCSFNFIPFKDIPWFYRLIEYLNSALPRKELDYFGIFFREYIIK